jgi:uracil-DNA glycosylase family 4
MPKKGYKQTEWTEMNEDSLKNDVFFRNLETVFKSEYTPRRHKLISGGKSSEKKRSVKQIDTKFPCENCSIKCDPVLSKACSKPKPVMMIGMYPGWEEAKAGLVFVGESGTYMHKVLEDAGFTVEDTYETNVMKCRPLDEKGRSRSPTDKEFKTCGKWLIREIQEVNPSLIVLMGDLPLRFFFNRKAVTPVRGQVKMKGDYKFLITYNPAHITREPEESVDRKAFERDIRSAFEIYAGVNRVRNREYVLVNDREMLDTVVVKLSDANVISVDLETYAPGTTKKEKKSLDPYAEGFKIISASISMEMDKAYCFLLEHPESQIPLEIVLSKISPLLIKPIPKVGQNIKYDFKVAGVHFGIYMENIVFDTMLASALLDSRKGIHNLDRLAMDWLGESSYKYEQSKIGTYIPKSDDLCIRNCTDADYALRLYPILKQRLIDEDLYNYYMETEIPATPALGRVEIRGLPVNLERVREVSKIYEIKLGKALQQIYEYQEVKEIKNFNIDSNLNLQELFFEKLGFDPVRKTKTGFSVDKDTLKVLQTEYKHPLLDLLHDYKTSTKFKSTYIDPLITTHVKYDGRVHPTFTQHVASTGRLSCVDPNMQNIPVRDEERAYDVMSCYEAPEGFKIGLADYCLHPDTEVECLGGKKTIKEVVDRIDKGEEIWAYCYRFDKDRIGLDRVVAGRKTGLNKEVWEVLLDNGEKIVATPEHKFMRRNGEYVELKDLKPGDSLMPFYSRYSKCSGTKAVYKQIKLYSRDLTKSEALIDEHRLVLLDILGYTKNDLKGKCVHHVDSCGINNLPENLQVLLQSEHYSLHRKNETEEVKKRADRGSWTKTEIGRKVLSKQAKKSWGSRTPEERVRIGKKISMKMPDQKGDKNFNYRKPIDWSCSFCKSFEKVSPYLAQRKYCNSICYFNSKKGIYPEAFKKYYETNPVWNRKNNHKVLSIRKFGCSDVYSITVENSHNFVLGAGVVVKNSQMELRIMAQMSQDPVMLEAFRRGEDLHLKTAKELTKIAGFEVSRQDAKSLNFGMVYGMTEYGLSESLMVEPKVAKVYLDAYLQLYKGVKEYQKEQISHLKQFGYVKTLFGRKRYIRMYGEDDREAENQAINTPIQGTATDINTMALTVLVKLYLEEGFRSFPISVIHDAIMFEMDDLETDLVALNLYIMENLDLPFLKDVKLKVDWSSGRTWADAKFNEKN